MPTSVDPRPEPAWSRYAGDKPVGMRIVLQIDGAGSASAGGSTCRAVPLESAVYVAYFVLLGAFWGLSPSIYKVLGPAGMPISHIIVLTGIGVGVGLAVCGRILMGHSAVDRRLLFYGLGCGALLNVPFSLQIMFAGHIPAAVLAIVFSTAPFCNYLLALATGHDRPRAHRVLALLAGLASSVVLVVTRDHAGLGSFSLWTLAAFSCPVLFAVYNWFTAHRWPPNVNIYQAGMAESFASALFALPFLLVFAPPWTTAVPSLSSYGLVAFLAVMWVAERIVYYTLIRDKGPVYTAQGIYVAAPAGVLYGIAFFQERPDAWLWVSLALILLALWLNNSRPDAKPIRAGQSPSHPASSHPGPERPASAAGVAGAPEAKVSPSA
jgi:drug/metabolite transporter (DMT)-like permease